jgi:hypothetical protein
MTWTLIAPLFRRDENGHGIPALLPVHNLANR